MLSKSLYIGGSRGLAGQAITSRARASWSLLPEPDKIDYCLQGASFAALAGADCAIFAAGRVGGIGANMREPARFGYENALMSTLFIEEARQANVSRLLYLGSACLYPPITVRDLREEDWLSAAPDPSNRPYAMAKSMAVTLLQSYTEQYGMDGRALMPSNLYGPLDRFSPENGHAVGALIARLSQAVEENVSQVEVWGGGDAKREWLHADDLASATLFVLDLPKTHWQKALPDGIIHLNVGSGEEITTRDLAYLLAEILGFRGRLWFNPTRPEGPARRMVNMSRLRSLGWAPSQSLRDAIEGVCLSYQSARKGGYLRKEALRSN